MTATTEKLEGVLCREDGCLEGVHAQPGLNPCRITRRVIAGRMGWEDSGKAVAVIDRTLALLASGKSVKLTSHYGWARFTPLAAGESGNLLPTAYWPLYNGDGEIIERLAAAR